MFKKPSPGKKRGNLSQFGLLDVNLDDGDDEPMDLSDDDLDLEAELAAISGESKKHRPRKPAPVPPANLDAMIAASLKEVPSDDELSGDDDDPDLLNELQALSVEDDEAPPAPPPRASRPAPPPPGSYSTQSSTVSLLQDRILNYTAAEKQAKESGESSRARRFGRGIKTLNDLLKQAKAGQTINDSDIPPPVPLKSASDVAPPSAPPSAPVESAALASDPEPATEAAEEPPISPEPKEPPPPPPTVGEELDPAKQEGLQFILKRQQEFKVAALSCKQAGDKAMALEYLKVVKQFDIVVQAFKSGTEMDLSELPTPEAIAAAFRSQQKGEDHTQNAAEPSPPPVAPVAEEGAGLITASTVDEALKQRLAAFQQQEAKAREEGNSSKARRMGRIVKQYQDAIKAHAAGKSIPLDDLPTPAGYAPIPGDHASPKAAPPTSPAAAADPSPSPSPRPAPRAPASRYDKQIAFLLLRQKEFKEAALKAKKTGNIEQAKEYLRAAKGFDAVIEAARGGLTVDLKSLPLPPKTKKQIEQTSAVISEQTTTLEENLEYEYDEEDVITVNSDEKEVAADDSDDNEVGARMDLNENYLEKEQYLTTKAIEDFVTKYLIKILVRKKSFDVVSADDCTPPEDVLTAVDVQDDDVLTKLSYQLTNQLKLCLTNRDHYREMGNIAEMNRFEHLAVRVKQDLDVVVVAKSLGNPAPKFHYETQTFSIVQCNTDLNENDLELTIVRGITYNVPNPKEIDTYVKFEFPYPQDAPVSDRTSIVKDTNSPVYDAVFPLAIHRSARPCLRVFKRHGIKFEVYSRGGWFSRDTLLGTVSVKLAPLETQVTLHDAFPLMDGRRPAGGSLEIKLRVRTPLVQQQFENTSHRWLVVDN